MNAGVYISFIVKQHRGFIAFSMVVVGALQYVIISIVSGVDTAAILDGLLQQLPPRFLMFINEAFLAQLSVPGAAAFGFNHPLVLALIAISAISVSTRHMAGEIESGTMEWLLANPIRRVKLAASLWVSGVVIVLLTIVGAWAGSLAALQLKGDLNTALLGNIVRIGLNLWFLMILIMSYSLLLAVFSKDGGRAGPVAAAVTLSFYFVNVISAVWDRIAFLKPFNFFTYHQPNKIMFAEQKFALNALVLGSLTGACLLVTLLRFHRRDIPG